MKTLCKTKAVAGVALLAAGIIIAIMTSHPFRTQGRILSQGIDKNEPPPVDTKYATASDDLPLQQGISGTYLESPWDKELLEIAGRDLQEGLNFIAETYPEDLRQRAHAFLLYELSKEHLDVVLKIYPLLNGSLEKARAAAMIADYWTSRDSAVLLQFVRANLGGAVKNDFYERIVGSLVKRGRLDEAVSVFEEMPFSSARSNALGLLGRKLGSANPSLAIEWASKFELGEDRTLARQSVIETLANERNIAGLESAASAMSGDMRNEVFSKIGKVLGSRGVSEVLSVDTNGDVAARDALVAGAVESVPPRALLDISSAVTEIADGTLRSQAVAGMVNRLFDSAPDSAVTWVSTLQADVRSVAVSALVAKWYRTDSEALSDWINSVPNGNDRDIALESLVWQLRPTDIATAREMAQQIGDRRIRESLVRTLDVK